LAQANTPHRIYPSVAVPCREVMHGCTGTVDVEYPFQVPCPGHGLLALFRCSVHVFSDGTADSDYGLSSAVITNDLQKAIALSEGLEAGAVHINGQSVRDEPVIPFGGVKAVI
jgi:hypothetical protein